MTRTALMLDKLLPSARIVDGILILTLPDALKPVVWQMELGQTKSSAVEVREQGDGTFVLMLKTNRQDVQEIAPYATREQAVRALMTLSKAMESAQGQLRQRDPANMNSSGYLPAIIPQQAGDGKPSKALRAGIGIAAILFLLFLFSKIDGSSIPTPDTPSVSSGASGEPLSADDYLK